MFLHSYVLVMTIPQFVFALTAAISLCTGPALAQDQDAQSLGDVARQARQQKQQQANSNLDTSSTDPQNAAPNANDPQTPKPSHVITNDEIPEHAPRVPSNTQKRPSGSTAKEGKRPPEYWKAQVQQLKNSIASLQRRIDVLNGALHAVLTNPDDEPVWNLREKEKERQLAELQAQMTDLERRLEDTQEAARRQGYGSSVYDP